MDIIEILDIIYLYICGITRFLNDYRNLIRNSNQNILHWFQFNQIKLPALELSL